MKKFIFLLPLALFTLGACGGGGAKSTNINSSTTMGQELTDLQAARDKGLISEKEYNKARKDILKSRKK